MFSKKCENTSKNFDQTIDSNEHLKNVIQMSFYHSIKKRFMLELKEFKLIFLFY